ncbi:MAG: UDP-N-acetylglucosamine 1-carboxyvinyltransferase [Nitrospirae bacterium RBG_19FT_COMBO_42_15]|nr:MAG: UDP-N-acetylglucosamine 1-carboxyvinyltransferase [Nitrospirae bacterium RBG_19FT_COMBO_42_15]
MQKIIINGGVKLKGEVKISGAKNAALPIMAASLLAQSECVIHNVPKLMDVATMGKLISYLGAEVKGIEKNNTISINTKALVKYDAPYDLVKTMRASVLVLGPLIVRCGEAKISLPGGCAIGARPINLHLMGLEKMGAEIKLEHGYVWLKAKRLKGAKIYLDISTVTGTENLMMAAALAKGVTVIENAACEPEVVDLANFLNKMGAKVSGAGRDVITIEGVDSLKGTEYSVMPDRIETGTYAAAAAITEGDVLLKNCIPKHLDAVISKLRETGAEVIEEADSMRVKRKGRLKASDAKTLPYPGFPTDMQAQFMALMSIAEGTSIITETIFENRFTHVSELKRMGADIKIQGNTAVVKGAARLSGAPVMATDLRASASLIIAGIAAEGETEVSRIYHLDRGYEMIEEKMSALGAKIKRVQAS